MEAFRDQLITQDLINYDDMGPKEGESREGLTIVYSRNDSNMLSYITML